MVKIMITVIMQDHDDQKYAVDCVKCWIVGLTTLDPHPPQQIPPMAAPLSLILPFIIIIITIVIIIININIIIIINIIININIAIIIITIIKIVLDLRQQRSPSGRWQGGG